MTGEDNTFDPTKWGGFFPQNTKLKKITCNVRRVTLTWEYLTSIEGDGMHPEVQEAYEKQEMEFQIEKIRAEKQVMFMDYAEGEYIYHFVQAEFALMNPSKMKIPFPPMRNIDTLYRPDNFRIDPRLRKAGFRIAHLAIPYDVKVPSRQIQIAKEEIQRGHEIRHIEFTQFDDAFKDNKNYALSWVDEILRKYPDKWPKIKTEGGELLL